MSNETKQNSIDWLINEIDDLYYHIKEFNIHNSEHKKLIMNSIKKAKEMYNKELELAYEDGKEIRHILNTIEKNQF
jgi:hypothetical protein